MTSQFVSELTAARDVNERAAAYAGEIIRLNALNAQLLSALEFAMDQCDLFPDVAEQARAAIRKAKGE